jgi:acetyl-CoA carboxylase biotin carboxyl carrier protein
MDIDLEELAAIVELLDKADFSEFRFDKGDLHIHVRRGPLMAEPSTPSAATVASVGQPAVSSEQPRPAQQTTPAPVTAAAAVPPAELPDGLDVVRSPMLGTFYSCPKPGEKPFVEAGQLVEADTVVCIVEVMKLMNSVRAGVAGEIVEIYPRDGDLVEFEQPLFAVRTTP